MSSFVIATNTTSGQFLNTGEFGFVAPSGSILAAVGSAVTLSNNATLISYGAMASSTASGLVLNSVTNTSVTIAASGSVVTGGIELAAISGTFTGNFALHNAGAISGGQGINLTAAAFSQIDIANDGSLQGLGITAGSALDLILNNTSRAIITNTGMLSTAGNGPTVYALGGGNVTLTNTGNILNATPGQAGIYVFGGLTLRNSGYIEGNVTSTQSSNIFNSGTIDGNLVCYSFNDAVRISGIVMGNVLLGNGVNAFWLTGGRVMGQVTGGAGNDTYHVDRSDLTIVDTTGGLDKVYSSVDFQLSAGIEELHLNGGPRGLIGTGTITANVITGDAGGDTLRGLAGDDLIDGAEGNNRIYGGFGADKIFAGTGDDWIFGGSGNDVIHMYFGNDIIDGGFGEDVLIFDLLTDPGGVVANLSTRHYSYADMGVVTVTGIEDLVGTLYADALTGNLLANVISGGAGNDTLYGLSGDDRLTGGGGADVMVGGLGADTFVYTSVSDSPSSGRDAINDFRPLYDFIDLSAIDAVAGGADDAFRFLGTAAFTGTVGEVRYLRDVPSATTLVEVRLAGSVVDDMDIVIKGLITLNATSFIL